MDKDESGLDILFRKTAIFFGVLLFMIGAYLAYADKTSSATASYGFGFLLFSIGFLSKFKRFKGFGFDAELWDQKQIEAAALVEQLRRASLVTAKQIVYVATNVGKWGPPACDKMIELEKDILSMLSDANVSPHERECITKPLSSDIFALAKLEFIHMLCDTLNKGNTDKAKAYKETRPKGTVALTEDLIRIIDWADWISEDERQELKTKADKYQEIMRKFGPKGNA